MNKISFCGKTDVGKMRTNNEDAFIAQKIWDDKHILAVAIDGVGGYEGGEIASALAQKSIVKYLETYSNGERLELLRQAVVSANNTIFAERKKNERYNRMSCVLTAVLIEVENKRINMAHVGDTRLYQYTNGIITKLSHDHSLVGYREEIGELTEEEAMKHPQRNVIGRDVGSQFLESDGGHHIEAESFPLLPNSTLLLCSDGLCDMITSEQMKVELSRNATARKKVEALIKAANDAGGKDNVTVVVITSENPDAIKPVAKPQPVGINSNPEPTPAQELRAIPQRPKTSFWFLNGAIAILLVALGFIVGWQLTLNRVTKQRLHQEQLQTTKADSLATELTLQQTLSDSLTQKVTELNVQIETLTSELYVQTNENVELNQRIKTIEKNTAEPKQELNHQKNTATQEAAAKN